MDDPHRNGRPPEPRSDEALMLSFRDGDSRAFEELVARHRRGLFNFLLRSVQNRSRAEELLQEVFLRVVRSKDRYERTAKLTTWLYTIARHTCLNHLRHKAVLPEESLEAQQEDRPGSEPVDAAMNVAAIAETRELQRAVNDVLATLPAEPRMLLVLRDFEQLSYDEISQITELSIVNVKSKIHRARQAFKKRFAPFLELLGGGLER